MTETQVETPEAEPVTEPEPETPETPADEPETEEEQEESGESDPEEEVVARVRNANDPARAERLLKKKLSDERKRHSDRLEAILGDAADETLPCPLCFAGLQGYVLPFDAGDLADEQKAAALAFISGEAGSQLRRAEGVEECPRCDGYGQLLFPTKVPHTLEQMCPACNGAGYVVIQAEQPPAPTFLLPAPSSGMQPNGSIGPCPICGTPGMAGQPHYCVPVAAAAV